MRNTKGSLRVGIAIVLLSFNLTACGGRIKAATQVTPVTQTPSNFYNDISQTPVTNPTTNYSQYGVPTTPTGIPNTQAGTFKVDQATFNQWQARGIAVSSGTIYVTAADTSGLSKKGTIVKMNAADGKNWKDIASKWLGLSHPMDSTVTGLAVSGGTLIATDSGSKIYSVDASTGNVTVMTGSGATDVTAGAGSIFIANGAVSKTDTSVSSMTPIAGLSASGGVGSDNLGNVYAVSGLTIKKADPTGQVQDVVTTNLTAPIDVAVDGRNGDIYVLEQTMIKRFNTNGQFLVSFANGATKPVAIATDETGAVYVADAGSTNKDSQVIKFAAAVDAMINQQANNGYNNTGYGTSTSAYGNNGYGTYSNTGY